MNAQPIIVTIAGTEWLPVGSTVQVDITIEMGPSTTIMTSNTTISSDAEKKHLASEIKPGDPNTLTTFKVPIS